jgi:hypothetical protein
MRKILSHDVRGLYEKQGGLDLGKIQETECDCESTA